MFRLLVLLFAAVSAFEIPSVLSRRAFAQAAAAPLAIAAAANADAPNGYMNAVGKAGLGEGSISKYGTAGGLRTTKGDSKLVDEYGSAAKPSASLTPGPAAAYANSVREKTPAQEAALKHLLK